MVIKRVNIARGIRLGLSLCIVTFVTLSPRFACSSQNELKGQPIDSQVVEEPGCPISVKAIRAELDIDPFQTAVAIRVYLDYKNDSDKTVEAVKFRFRLQDAQGANKGTYQASDTHIVPPGETAQEKLRREAIHPQVKRLLLRVLQIRFSDQSSWQSAHMPSPDSPQDKGSTAPNN